MSQDDAGPPSERRGRKRNHRENAATELVQLILRDPSAAAAALEDEIASGTEIKVVLGVLDAAEAILRLRGVDRSPVLARLRKQISLYRP